MNEHELIRGPVPGPQTRAATPGIARFESRNVTFLGDDFPVFWESASGATITDVDGNRYIDLESAFGVASVGHGNARVRERIIEQAHVLMHGMGDVHPTRIRAELLERLTHHVPPGLTKTVLSTNGSDAVETALETAVLHTGKTRFIAYRDAYHGLSLGALAVCGIPRFAEPFRGLVPDVTTFLAYPDAQRISCEAALAQLDATLARRDDVAALILEPIQGRGGCIVPPAGYLRGVRERCAAHGIVMIVDEIYTGFGRTGSWFACDAEAVVPDILCIGKAMGGGFPISAAVARAEVMDAWPRSGGEALHTWTYLGNPMGCAAALASIEEIERHDLVARAHRVGTRLGERLMQWRSHANVVAIRGRGMMWGVQMRDGTSAESVVKRALARGVILLQSGPRGDALSITPPLVISDDALHRALDIVEEIL